MSRLRLATYVLAVVAALGACSGAATPAVVQAPDLTLPTAVPLAASRTIPDTEVTLDPPGMADTSAARVSSGSAYALCGSGVAQCGPGTPAKVELARVTDPSWGGTSTTGGGLRQVLVWAGLRPRIWRTDRFDQHTGDAHRRRLPAGDARRRDDRHLHLQPAALELASGYQLGERPMRTQGRSPVAPHAVSRVKIHGHSRARVGAARAASARPGPGPEAERLAGPDGAPCLAETASLDPAS
jgi:hypothetical protein